MIMLSAINTKWKVILLVMFLMCCICVTFISLYIFDSKEYLNKLIDAETTNIRAIISVVEENNTRRYRNRIESFVNYLDVQDKEPLISFFARRNRDELLLLSAPFLRTFKKENPYFRSFAWITPDNYAFLRVHRPSFFGDYVGETRPDIMDSNKNLHANSSFVITKSGVQYRLVQPVTYGGQHVGLVQFGIHINLLLETLDKKQTPINGVVIPNGKFSVITQSSLPSLTGKAFTIQSKEIDLFISVNDVIDWNLKQQKVKLQKKTYIIANVFDLQNYRQESQGFIFMALDISEYESKFQSRIVFVLSLTAILLSLSFFILYSSYSTLIQKIVDLNTSLQKGNDNLERQVKKRTEKLQQQREEWEKTFNAIPDIITLQDKNMRIIKANKATFDFFGSKGNRVIGQKCYEIFRGDKGPCPGCPGTATLQNTHCHLDTIVHDRLGKTFLVSSASVLNAKKEVQYLVHVAKDITEQKLLEEELVQAQKMEAIGTLAGGIAHDFNNILSVIIGYSEIVKYNIQNGTGQPEEEIDQVLTAGKRAASLVKQILTFSRKTKHDTQALSLHLIVKETLKMLRASLPTTITIEHNIDTECGEILADPTKIHQIVVNLCTNAAHAMAAEKGTLNISLSRRAIQAEQVKERDTSPGDYIVLSVSDTGHGMDPDTIKRIFEPYFTTKAVDKGTGLGLAVILGIVNEYNGFVEVKSEVNKGSSFDVYIPAIDKDSIIKKKTSDKELSLPTGTERILLVDDEDAINKINKTELARLGYTVCTTTDSRDALTKIRADPDQFDLLITDQTMPVMNGSELAQEVLQIKPNMPIILSTGYSSIVTENEALVIGFKRYIRKPVDRETLANIVRLVLDEKDS